jgi:hypothetical protein
MAPAPTVVSLTAHSLGVAARSHDELVDLLRARKDEIGLSDGFIDECALSAGACSKLFGTREKGLGRSSLDGLLIALACSLVLVPDPDRERMMRPQWEARQNAKVHPPQGRIAIATIDKVRRSILRDLNTLSRAVSMSNGGTR